MYKGIGASAGIGIGNVVIIKENDLKYENVIVENTDAELVRFNSALAKFCDETNKMADKIESEIGKPESDIIRGHTFMISDPFMKSEIEKLIANGECAEQALATICDMFANMFLSTDDELTKQRATDVNDIKNSMLKILLNIEEVKIEDLPQGTILVANDLIPSMTVRINKNNVVGIITEIGGKTSHSAIISRALEIPAVLSVSGITDIVKNSDSVIIDGETGTVIVNPNDAELSEYAILKDKFLQKKELLKAFKGKKTQTADGKVVELCCNIGKSDDAQIVLDCDGEGVGLFRTEFLFMDKDKAPTEDEQFEAYKKAALILKDKPLIIRTLDVGGDKEISYLNIKKEENPFLGFRAVRYCLKNQDLYKSQLSAMLRASAFGNIKIMVPMVTCVDELRSVKALVSDIKSEFDKTGVAYNKDIEIGVMIETPAACLIADILAKEADFFSIGTNDLTQYTMAVDRGNKDVSYLYSTYNPAVLRAIKLIIACAHKENIPVGMCGEAAADAKMIPLLIGFGLDEFSTNPVSVLSTRKIISMWNQEKAKSLVEKVLSVSTESEVEQILTEETSK